MKLQSARNYKKMIFFKLWQFSVMSEPRGLWASTAAIKLPPLPPAAKSSQLSEAAAFRPTTLLCSASVLKQFEQRSFFQAFWAKVVQQDEEEELMVRAHLGKENQPVLFVRTLCIYVSYSCCAHSRTQSTITWQQFFFLAFTSLSLFFLFLTRDAGREMFTCWRLGNY